MSDIPPICVGQVLQGALFSEPMRVEWVTQGGAGAFVVGLSGVRSERFRRVNLTLEDLRVLKTFDCAFSYKGDGHVLRLAMQAYSLGIAYEFDPYFGLSISRVDPLPHQLEAVYDYLLKLARVRFLLADDAGAGKTIMAGLLLRELKLRGLAERTLIVCPSNLAFQWQRELKEKFDEKFTVLKGDLIREQFGSNQWQENPQAITSLDLAKREEILPGLRQSHWDLIVVDEAHRMSWSPPSRKTARYALGELLRDTSDHLLLLTATPHKGDPENFSLFLQLLDEDAFADAKSIHQAMEKRTAPFYLRRTKEAMVYFPQRQADGSWQALKIFTKRIPKVTDFHIDGTEDALYRDVMQEGGAVPEIGKRKKRSGAVEPGEMRAVTTLDRVHAAMLLLADSQTHALRALLKAEQERGPEFLRLANALSALYPKDGEEKRLLDAMIQAVPK
jgi:superfamily II DNA or RNA helicase